MYLPDLFASLPASRAERWQRLEALVAAWFGPLRAEDGVPEDEIRAAEARLGFALPAAVREAYLVFGRREEITAGTWTLTPPDKLRVQRGMLVLYSDQWLYRWGIRRDDLSLDDPPVVAGNHDEEARPALAGDDATASRFFLFMAILQTLDASRYLNTALEVPRDALDESLAKSFGVLDFGEVDHPGRAVEHPGRARRFYGGHLCIVEVDPSEQEVRVGAPDLESCRAAVAALGDLAWDSSPESANRGSFREQKRVAAELEEMFSAAREEVLVDVRRDVHQAEQRRLRWADVTPDEDDLDPRLRALVVRGLAPYVKLLPPVAHGFIEESTALMLDVHPVLTGWARAFLGVQGLDAEWTVRHPGRYEDFVKSVAPEAQEVAKMLVADGTPERLEKWIGRLEGRGGVLSRGTAVDSALLHRTQEDTMRLLFRWPFRPPANPEARAYELRGIVRQILASHFAGIVEQLFTFKAAGYADALDGYVWAELAYESFEGEPRDAYTLLKYYRGGGENEVRREDAERFRAILDRLADAIESAAEELGLPDGKAGTWGPEARPWVMGQVAKERARLQERRKKT